MSEQQRLPGIEEVPPMGVAEGPDGTHPAEAFSSFILTEADIIAAASGGLYRQPRPVLADILLAETLDKFITDYVAAIRQVQVAATARASKHGRRPRSIHPL